MDDLSKAAVGAGLFVLIHGLSEAALINHRQWQPVTHAIDSQENQRQKDLLTKLGDAENRDEFVKHDWTLRREMTSEANCL